MKRREGRKISILAILIVSVLWSGLTLSAETLQKIRFAIASRSNIVAPKHIVHIERVFQSGGAGDRATPDESLTQRDGAGQ